ncbi:MAG: hypothetical protein PHH49_04960 [Candidatus Omnitrophica bacterium]|nr:hypothetical protein [Candidatus Omnitrophota bacterium]MDD5488295.1 hypothetical protein [Candidatus Omnitrophota bacterium]
MKRRPLFLLIIALFWGILCANTLLAEEEPINPVIIRFLQNHQDLGTPFSATAMPDWAMGKRQEIATSKATYLFLLKGHDIEAVYRHEKDGSRTKIFSRMNQGSPQAKKAKVSGDSGLPAHEVLGVYPLMVNGRLLQDKMGEVLIPGYIKDDKAKAEDIIRKISKKHGFLQASFYATKEAYKADNSAAYSSQHPGALEEGYIGSYNKGQVTVK